jgi:hypothetical protein
MLRGAPQFTLDLVASPEPTLPRMLNQLHASDPRGGLRTFTRDNPVEFY